MTTQQILEAARGAKAQVAQADSEQKNAALQSALDALDPAADPLTQARHCRDEIFAAMQALRARVDEAEGIVAQSFWPFPGYGELLTTK